MKLLRRPRTLTQSKLVFPSSASGFIYNGVVDNSEFKSYQQRDAD